MAAKAVDDVLKNLKAARDGAQAQAAIAREARLKTDDLLAEIQQPRTTPGKAAAKKEEAESLVEAAKAAAIKAQEFADAAGTAAKAAAPKIKDLENEDKSNAEFLSQEYLDNAITAAEEAKADAELARSNYDLM
jgi:hypothetical protein